jgi:hypothetical protein
MDIINHNKFMEEIKDVVTGFWVFYNFNYSEYNGFEWNDLLKHYDNDNINVIEYRNNSKNSKNNSISP